MAEGAGILLRLGFPWTTDPLVPEAWGRAEATGEPGEVLIILRTPDENYGKSL